MGIGVHQYEIENDQGFAIFFNHHYNLHHNNFDDIKKYEYLHYEDDLYHNYIRIFNAYNSMKIKFRYVKMYDIYDYKIGHVHKDNNYDDLLLKMDRFWTAGIQLYFPEKIRHNTILFTKKEYFEDTLSRIFKCFENYLCINTIDLTIDACIIVMTFDIINELLNKKHTENNEKMSNIQYYNSSFTENHFTLKFFPNYESDVSFLNRITGREHNLNNINQRIRRITEI